jgi:hypothetical protein
MKLRLPMRMPADVGMEMSPTLTPVFASMSAIVESSDCGASNSFFASSETNFTLRSGPRRIDGTPAATRRCTTLVIAGDADSSGNGTIGAFGNGSASSCCAAAACEPEPDEACGAGGLVRASGAASGAGADDRSEAFTAPLLRRGLSHFSQRIPPVTSRPHMKHFLAISRLQGYRSYAPTSGVNK